MGSRWLARTITVTATAGVLALAAAAPALADSTITINPGNVPTTAAGFDTHECDENFGGTPGPGQDIWVFNLPGNHNVTGDFVSVTATFSTPGGGTETLTIPADGGAIVLKGTSKAWISTPGGWTLTGATAVITGTADKFVLTHTCPGSGGGSSPSPSISAKPSGQPQPSGSPSADSTVPPGTGGVGGDLPVTGAGVVGMVIVGVALVLGGGALLVVRRRRPLA